MVKDIIGEWKVNKSIVNKSIVNKSILKEDYSQSFITGVVNSAIRSTNLRAFTI